MAKEKTTEQAAGKSARTLQGGATAAGGNRIFSAIALESLGALPVVALNVNEVPTWEQAETKAKEAIEAAMLSFEFGGSGLTELVGKNYLDKLNKISRMAKLGRKTRQNLSRVVKKLRETLAGMWAAGAEQIADFDEVERALEDFEMELEGYI